MAKHAKKSEHLQIVESPKALVEVPLPLLGALTGARNAFFELCVDAGRQVLDALMEQDREGLCGPLWKRDSERVAGRAGTTPSAVTLGGRRVRLDRPRVRNRNGQEVELPSFAFASSRDALDDRTLGAMACGVSTRKYRRSLERLPEDFGEQSISKSAVSRRFVALSQKQMIQWLTTPLGDRHFPIVMIDGIVLGDHTILIALGIDPDGKKQILGLREGATENSRVAKALLRDLVDRGLSQEQARLFVIDGAKAIRTAIRKIFGHLGVVQRCQLHKQRNVLGHLPEHLHASVKAVLTEAWAINDAAIAQRRLERLASSLEANHPGAAGSVREGLSETLTLQRLGVAGALYRKLRTTNAIENLNSGIATYTRAETRAHRLATSSEPGATGKIKGVGPMTSNRKYEEVLDEDLQNPAEAAQYLSACLESGEPEVFLLALRDVARARGGVAKLAELTELNREHLYRMLSENGNPELRSLETLLDALGFRLAVALKEAS